MIGLMYIDEFWLGEPFHRLEKKNVASFSRMSTFSKEDI